MMSLNVWKKTLLIWCEERFLKKFSKQELKLDILNYWWFWWLNIDWSDLTVITAIETIKKICKMMFLLLDDLNLID